MTDQSGIVGERSTAQMIRDILRDVERMIQAEMSLAKTEFREEFQRVRGAGPLLALAGVAGLLAAGCFVLMVIALLIYIMPLWLAALIVGFALSGAGAAVFFAGREKIVRERPVMPETTESVRETAEWLKHRAS